MADPTLYGYKILNSTSQTSQTLDLTTLLNPVDGSALGPALGGQFTVIQIFVASNTDRNPAATGYAVAMDAYANDTNDLMLWAGYKFQPATPDTSITITGSLSSGSALIAIVTVWDNVDPTTPLDVASVNTSGINTAIPNPGSATPVTTGAVFLFGAGNASTVGTSTLSQSYMDWSVADSRDGSFDVSVLVGYKTGGVASTPYDGAALTWSGTDDVAFAQAANVIVLRPAPSGGSPQTITGALYSDTDAFGAGTFSTTYTITGSLYSDADTFGAGAFIYDQTITGAIYTDADSFGAGIFSLAGSPQTITGAIYVDADTFGAGAFSTAYTITGALYANPDSFGAGAFSASYTIIGAIYVNPDSFGAGSFSVVGSFPLDSGTGIWPGYRFATSFAPETREASPVTAPRYGRFTGSS